MTDYLKILRSETLLCGFNTMNGNERPKLINLSNGQSVEIHCDKFSVGRSLKCSYVLDSGFISRTHFLLEKIGNSWCLRDKSSNGTMVNSEKINFGQIKPLKDGDKIKFVSVDIEFRFQHSRGNIEDMHLSITDEQLCEVLDSVVSKENQASEHNILNDHCYEFQSIQLPICVNEVIISAEGNASTEPIVDSVLPTTSITVDTPHERKRSSSQDVSLPIDKTDESPNKKNKSDQELDVKGKPESCMEKNRVEEKNEMIEEEMQCSICSELFIKAVTLNCCHTFCKFCIEQWKKQQSCCPICRNKITSMAPTLVLDNFIEKHINQMDEETKKHRKEMIEHRTNTDKLNKTSAPSTSSFVTVNSGTSSSTTTSSAPCPTTVTISSEDEDEYDDEDDDFSDYDDDYFDYNGVPGKYYGGYGRCYNCNRRGHWANGCPYR